MYKIANCNYHYYYELTDWLDLMRETDHVLIQIIEQGSSGHPEKMHRVAAVFYKRGSFWKRVKNLLGINTENEKTTI